MDEPGLKQLLLLMAQRDAPVHLGEDDGEHRSLLPFKSF
jgi:hypothetical protein